MMFSITSFALLLTAVSAQSSFSPARPPAIPLAVSNPYLNTWQQAGSDGGNGGYLAGQWPTFWAGAITGWAGITKVDGGDAITWMGAPTGTASVANQISFEYTSTKSIFVLSIEDKVGLNVTFLSPVEPTDLQRMSISASYMNVEVYSIDGSDHDVQLYSDVSAEWASGDRSAIAEWDFGTIGSSATSKKRSPWLHSAPPTNWKSAVTTVSPIPYYNTSTRSSSTASIRSSSANSTYYAASVLANATSSLSATASNSTLYSISNSTSIPTSNSTLNSTVTPTSTSLSATATGASSASGLTYHRYYLQDQQVFARVSDQASWGHWVYACNHDSLTYSNGGVDEDVRGAFIANGTLDNDMNTDFRAINDDYPVFAFAINFESVGATAQSALFTLTLAQNESIQFEYGNNEVEVLPPLWANYFPDELELVSFFYNDWNNAQTTAASIDAQVASDSLANAGNDYLTITSLAVRQAFAATQLVVSQNETYLFMKEISSDGDIQTVDVIFPAFPIFLYFNPNLARMLLSPLFINQEAGNWPYMYSIHDLGYYPNATGHNDGSDEMQPLEECGNMIIMTLAVAQRINDTSYLNDHYDLLKQWNNYLVNDSLVPSNQISTDDFAGSLANQTNLALKGIIGIEAMAVIANMTGHTEDAANFTSIAHDYIAQWQTLGIAQGSDGTNGSLPHTTLAYGMNDTHGLLYNLYSDALLGTNLVPLSVYTMQSNFYPSVALQYGVPLDTRHNETKLDWEIFCASIASPETKNMFISKIATWINQTPTNRPYTDLYDAETGDYPSDGPTFIARPVVGGVFAPLLLSGQGPLGSS